MNFRALPMFSTRFSALQPLTMGVGICRSVLLWLTAGSMLCSQAGCRQAPARALTRSTHLLAGETMGTLYSIKLVATLDAEQLGTISREVDAELERVNDQMSTYRESSEVSQFNASHSTDWFPVSADTASVVQLAQNVSRQTGGAFDVTVSPLVKAWGFGGAARPEALPNDQTIDALLDQVGYQHLEVRAEPPALRKKQELLQIDLSAIAKGHGVDRVAAVLEKHAVHDYFVEIGGEVRVGGTKSSGQAWRVGIERPANTANAPAAAIQAVVELTDESLATSGDYRAVYAINDQRISHSIDPRTGHPVEHSLASASVMIDDCALADAIATSLMVLGPAEGLALAEEHGWAVCLIVRQDDQLRTIGSGEFQRRFPELASSPELELTQ